MVKIGIVRCDRDFQCAAYNCFMAASERDGALDYDEDVKIIGVMGCGRCRDGSISDELSKMRLYGADAIHLSSCLLAVYPPCPHIEENKAEIERRTNLPVSVGTHPLPIGYVDEHTRRGDWKGNERHLEKITGNLEESRKYDSRDPAFRSRLKRG